MAKSNQDPVRPDQVRRLVALMRARNAADKAVTNTPAPATKTAYRKAEALLAAAARISSDDEIAEAARQVSP